MIVVILNWQKCGDGRHSTYLHSTIDNAGRLVLFSVNSRKTVGTRSITMDSFEIFGHPDREDMSLANQHAVIVHFTYFKDDLDPLHNLDRKLARVIEEKNVGVYDGHEINLDMSDGFLYMYGPNAEALFKAVRDFGADRFYKGIIGNTSLWQSRVWSK